VASFELSFSFFCFSLCLNTQGRVACEMGSNELIITELVFNNQLTERPPEEIAALLSREVLTKQKFGSVQDVAFSVEAVAHLLNYIISRVFF
jgi:superfamily II RNA helicase